MRTAGRQPCLSDLVNDPLREVRRHSTLRRTCVQSVSSYLGALWLLNHHSVVPISLTTTHGLSEIGQERIRRAVRPHFLEPCRTLTALSTVDYRQNNGPGGVLSEMLSAWRKQTVGEASPSAPVLRFRSAFWPVWWVTTIWSSGLAFVVVVVICLIYGLPLRIPSLVIGLVCALLCGVLVAVTVVLFPVYVYPDGLRCYDFFGDYRLAYWDRIDRTSTANLLGLRYLRVFATDLRKPRWLPLFLADMDGFVEAVYQRTGRDHPLIAALERSRR